MKKFLDKTFPGIASCEGKEIWKKLCFGYISTSAIFFFIGLAATLFKNNLLANKMAMIGSSLLGVLILNAFVLSVIQSLLDFYNTPSKEEKARMVEWCHKKKVELIDQINNSSNK